MSTQQPTAVALSIKQPWAALLVAGVKTIEVRRWSTARRGRVLIHAAGVPDSRPEGWKLVSPDLIQLAQLGGGILGAAELTACKHYADAPVFQADQPLHRNEPSWFEPAGLYGFVFAHPEILPFRKVPGWLRFFTVDAPTDLPHQRTAP